MKYMKKFFVFNASKRFNLFEIRNQVICLKMEQEYIFLGIYNIKKSKKVQ